jgi:nitronate monooxygenase
VAWSTAFTEMFGVRYPIASAPMGGSAGGALAAAVSNAGGLGLIGGGNGHPKWLEPELSIVADRTDRPWGVGLLSWAVEPATVERVLEHEPAAVMLSFGTSAELTGPVHQAGTRLILQVTSMDEAREAVDLGADVIVAQGTEAGGHGARAGRSTLPFVPAVADLVAPTPVLAAGGIGDGRGLAAALVLGASGALIGTRFQATQEALADPGLKKAIVAGRARRPSGAACSTSCGGRAGRGSTPGGHWVIRCSSSGGAGRPSWPATPRPGRPTRTGWPAVTCRPCRCGPGRRWTWSTTCRRPLTWCPC